jgi:hypothetical protein
VSDYGTLVGGAETGLVILRDGLRRLGHDARVFSSSARPGGESFADYECLGTTSSFRTVLQTANPWAALGLRRVLGEFKPDVVHVKLFLTQLSPLVQPVLREVPSLYHVVWYRPVCPLGTKRLPDGRGCREPAGRACYRNGCLPLRDWAPLMLQLRLWRHWRDCFDLVVANSETTKRQLITGGIEPVGDPKRHSHQAAARAARRPAYGGVRRAARTGKGRGRLAACRRQGRRRSPRNRARDRR